MARSSGSAKGPGARGRVPVTFHPDLTTVEQLERFYHQPQEYIGGKRCTDPFKMMMVKTDGTVIPAHSRCYNYPLGNVQETPLTLEETYGAKRYQLDIRMNFKK